jgi:hypothetical protein
MRMRNIQMLCSHKEIDMSFKSNGNLDNLRKNLSELSGTTEVKLVDLMNADFISSCSEHSSLEELIDASGFKVESKEDFEAIPGEEWEVFIKDNTSHESWLEMQNSALLAYTKANLFKGIK